MDHSRSHIGLRWHALASILGALVVYPGCQNSTTGDSESEGNSTAEHVEPGSLLKAVSDDEMAVAGRIVQLEGGIEQSMDTLLCGYTSDSTYTKRMISPELNCRTLIINKGESYSPLDCSKFFPGSTGKILFDFSVFDNTAALKCCSSAIVQETPSVYNVGDQVYLVTSTADGEMVRKALGSSQWETIYSANSARAADGGSVPGVSESGQLVYRDDDNAGRFGSTLMGGGLMSELDATNWGPGRTDIVAIAPNGSPYLKSYQDNVVVVNWAYLGGTLTAAPSIASMKSAWLDVAGRGTDNQAYMNTFYGTGWTGWIGLGGKFRSSIAVVDFPDRTDVFGVDSATGALMRRTRNAQYVWSANWENLGGNFTSNPKATRVGTTGLDVFVLDAATKALVRRSLRNGVFGAFENLGTEILKR